jgi:hypothetical protein
VSRTCADAVQMLRRLRRSTEPERHREDLKEGQVHGQAEDLRPRGSTSSNVGYDTVTGTLLKHGRAEGTVASHFDSGGGSDKTVSWTARD